MYRLFGDMKAEKRLKVLIIFFLTGFIAFGVLNYVSLNTVKIKGPLYNEIMKNREMIAEISLSSEYLQESYLLLMQMPGETDDSGLNELLHRSEALRNEYNSCHADYHVEWENTYADDDSKKLMTVEAFKAADEFFNIRDAEFIPAIKNGDIDKATELANGILKEKYAEHLLQINKALNLANEKSMADEVKAQHDSELIRIFLLILGLLIILGLLFMYYRIKRSFRPLSQIAEELEDISEKEGCISRRIEVNSEDEIGTISRSFNCFNDRIRNSILSIRDIAVELQESWLNLIDVSSETAANSEQTNNRINHVSAIINDINSCIASLLDSLGDTNGKIDLVAAGIEEMSGTTRNLASASEQTSASVTQISTLASNISRSINTLSDSSKDVSSLVSNVATAVKEINLSLNEINTNCERSIQITADASDKASDTNTIIKNLDKSSKQIEKIINVINDIADQTNMLALNAAIEAAGAGEAGKGFAVVANEVKELAKQTAEATDEIAEQIENMHLNMVEAVEAVGTITEVIKEINIITNTIAAAVTEQSVSTGEILNAVVKSADRVNQITNEIGEIATHSQNTARSISETSKGVEEIAKSATEISTASKQTAQSVDNLSSMLGNVEKVSMELSRQSKEICGGIMDLGKESSSVVGAADRSHELSRDLEKPLKNLQTILEKLIG